MKIKANLSINRLSSRDGSLMVIRVQDESSRAEFLELELSMEQFGHAITGLSHIPVEGVVRGLHVVGKVREGRTEYVDCVIPLDREQAERLILESAAPFEVDGWKASAYSAINSQGGRKLIDFKTSLYRCRVDLYRFVDAPAVQDGQTD